MNTKTLRSGLLPLLLLIFSLSLAAQTKTITGKVIDQDSKKPLKGVSIGVKGSNKAVVSDNTGAFSISVYLR